MLSRSYVIVVVIIVVTVLSLSVDGSGSSNACSKVIGAYLEAAYKCTPEEFRETVACELDRLRLSCPKTKYLVIHSAQIQASATPSHCSASAASAAAASIRLTHDDETHQGGCSAACVRQLFINPCQGRRRCAVDTGSKKFRVASAGSCHPPSTEGVRRKRSINVIYTCVVKSVIRSVFSNSTHHSSPLVPDPCQSVTMETQSIPLHAVVSTSVSRRKSSSSPSASSPSSSSLPPFRSRSSTKSWREFSVVAMVTPVAALAAAAVEGDDHGQSGSATDQWLSEEIDHVSTQMVVGLAVTSESVQSSQGDLGADETGTPSDTMGHELEVSIATVAKTTEDDDLTTMPRTTDQTKWSTMWFNHLSSDWAWSYHYISENKEKFFLYLALAISLGFIFILFVIVLRLSIRKPLASHPTDSPTHRCRCSGSLSPKADPGGSSARQPLTMSCTSPITWRLPDIDPSIAGDERPGRGCEVQLTSFNRLNSLPRLRRESIVDVPPPPSPVSSSADHVHHHEDEEEVLSSDVVPVSSPPEALVTTTATISRSHLNFIDNHSFGPAPPRPLTNLVSRPVTTVVTLPLTTTDLSGEASTAFTRPCEGNGTAVVSELSPSSYQFDDQPGGQRDPSSTSSLAGRVSVRPMAKFGSFGRNQGGSPCGREYRELRQFSKTLQLPPGNHYFCT